MFKENFYVKYMWYRKRYVLFLCCVMCNRCIKNRYYMHYIYKTHMCLIILQCQFIQHGLCYTHCICIGTIYISLYPIYTFLLQCVENMFKSYVYCIVYLLPINILSICKYNVVGMHIIFAIHKRRIHYDMLQIYVYCIYYVYIVVS